MKVTTRPLYVHVIEASLIGLVAGLSAVILSLAVDWIGAHRLLLADKFGAFWALPLYGLVGGLIAGFLVEKFAPEAGGSGIPQVRAALNHVTQQLTVKIAAVKLVGGALALGSGLLMGREGPTVQVGGALAAQLTRWFPTTARHRRQLIAAGAGAGLTAAFNSPLAGIVFVLEELLKEVKPLTITIAILACFSASVIQNWMGHSFLRDTMHEMAVTTSFDVQDIPFYLVLGIVAGAVGAVFNKGIIFGLNLNQSLFGNRTTIRVGVAGLISGLLVAVLPATMHDYAGMRGLIVDGTADPANVPLAFFAFFFLVQIAYGSGAPGGLFAPSLAIGSALGFMVSSLEHVIIGTTSSSTFALVGMGAVFSVGSSRVDLQACKLEYSIVSPK